MSKLSDPEMKKKSTSHLKLVVSNPPCVRKTKLFSTLDPNMGFMAKIEEKGQDRYTMMAYDPFHRLDCEILLEICDDEDVLEVYDEEVGPRTVICHFPPIIDKELNEFVEGDETLCGMIMVQFQMKILEQLLLFCSNHDASTLLVWVDHTAEGHALEVYQNSAVYEDKIPTITGTKTQLVIPATLETFDNLMDYTDDIHQDFRKILWEDQSNNPAIREYLKLNPCLKFFD